MPDVTHLVTAYRECVRHLWNTYFRPIAEGPQDWDLCDEFDVIARAIFSSLVLSRLGDTNHGLAPRFSAEPTPLPGFRVIPAVTDGTPIHINRDIPRTGYWDHPVAEVRPDDVELHFLRFFDWDELGHRDFAYYEVMVHASRIAEIVGRAALIKCAYARVLYDAPAS
jgi:hypothetical protein